MEFERNTRFFEVHNKKHEAQIPLKIKKQNNVSYCKVYCSNMKTGICDETYVRNN